MSINTNLLPSPYAPKSQANSPYNVLVSPLCLLQFNFYPTNMLVYQDLLTGNYFGLLFFVLLILILLLFVVPFFFSGIVWALFVSRERDPGKQLRNKSLIFFIFFFWVSTRRYDK